MIDHTIREITLRGTIRIRVSTIFSKIGVRIPAEVVAVARDAGLNGKP